MGHDRSIPLPHIPGHEMAGTIAAIADDVDGFSVGDRVTVPFVLGCGTCGQCASGNQQLCDNQYQPGFSGWGAFAQYVALPYAEENLVRLPEGMSFATAAGLGCRFATAFRAVVDQGAVDEGDTLAVWGCGGVGLSAVMIGAALGAEVFAVDIDDAALGMAASVGAAHVIDAGAVPDASRIIRDLTEGGVDVSLDALGSTNTSVTSIRSLRPRGRHIQVGLMIGDDAKPVIPMWRLHTHEIELYGSHGMQAWRYPAMLEMVADGRLEPDKLVTQTIALSEGAAHLADMADFPGTGFIVIDDFSA
jgi:alcohol dehydrogenase